MGTACLSHSLLEFPEFQELINVYWRFALKRSPLLEVLKWEMAWKRCGLVTTTICGAEIRPLRVFPFRVDPSQGGGGGGTHAVMSDAPVCGKWEP